LGSAFVLLIVIVVTRREFLFGVQRIDFVCLLVFVVGYLYHWFFFFGSIIIVVDRVLFGSSEGWQSSVAAVVNDNGIDKEEERVAYVFSSGWFMGVTAATIEEFEGALLLLSPAYGAMLLLFSSLGW